LPFEMLAASGAAFVIALVLTAVVRRWAIARQMVDVPNMRSSHSVPTPRGGGLAAVIAATFVLAALILVDLISARAFIALTLGSITVAAVGFVDDRRPVAPRLRLLVHVTAALWALYWLGGLPPLLIGEQLFTFGWNGYLLGLLGIVWTLNLFNFMDGIDGIAGSEAVFIGAAGAGIHYLVAGPGDLTLAAAVFAAACAGFLLWNWPPAKIFMGDVGSGYMGYMVAVLAVLAARDNPVSLLVWVILGGVFFVDATVTLVRRVARGERASEAHRSHAYQALARHWRGHRPVTIGVSLVNMAWLLPCAVLAAVYPRYAGWIVILALAPLIFAVLAAGAGKSESVVS
jgi:Fuc2NAc and GlcNAc transferase